MLAVDVRVGLFGQFSLFRRFCSLHLSVGDGSKKTEILPQRTVKSKTGNRHSTVESNLRMIVSLGPGCKLEGSQVTIRWSSGSKRWTTVLKIVSSIPSRS